jgi:hypothetical protein
MFSLFAEFFDIHVVVAPIGNFHQQRFCATLRTRNKTPTGVPFATAEGWANIRCQPYLDKSISAQCLSPLRVERCLYLQSTGLHDHQGKRDNRYTWSE